jgi:HSP20 family molecular chaperone IbpA
MTTSSATAMQPVRGGVPVRRESGDLAEEFAKMYDSIARRAFELFEGNGRWPGHDLDDWIRAEAELLHPVHLDLKESDSAFTVVAEVPGYGVKDLELKVEPRSLTIAGKREIKEAKEEKGSRMLFSESCADRILRQVYLPVDVDTAKVEANLRNGILTVDLPKATYAKAVHIEARS